MLYYLGAFDSRKGLKIPTRTARNHASNAASTLVKYKTKLGQTHAPVYKTNEHGTKFP